MCTKYAQLSIEGSFKIKARCYISSFLNAMANFCMYFIGGSKNLGPTLCIYIPLS